MNKSRKDEVQSRRDFFKKAAKGVLPILGAAMLMNVPQVLRATESQCDCSGTCIGSCKGTVMELVLLHVKEVARVLVMVGALLVAKGRVQERVRMDVRVVLVSLL